uniref:Transcription repressor n=1 Tax=Leersia perrieri TaxID=77586 RepID=A0A0D9X2Y1_9ORYZ
MPLPLFHRSISLLPLSAKLFPNKKQLPTNLTSTQFSSRPPHSLPSSTCFCYCTRHEYTMPLPTSWLFHKLRRRNTARVDANAAAAAVVEAPIVTATATACSPNRASYYFPSKERCRLPPPPPRVAAMDVVNPKLRDTRFPPRSPQPTNDIVFDVVAVSMAPMPELKLRPIVTKRSTADDDGEAASSPVACRMRRRRINHAKKKTASPARRRRRWLYESVVVVKESADPEEDFLASMAEMIAAAANDGDGGGVRSARELEELLACYLALNAADHHRAIVAAFRRVWLLAAGDNKSTIST